MSSLRLLSPVIKSKTFSWNLKCLSQYSNIADYLANFWIPKNWSHEQNVFLESEMFYFSPYSTWPYQKNSSPLLGFRYTHKKGGQFKIHVGAVRFTTTMLQYALNFDELNVDEKWTWNNRVAFCKWFKDR